MSVCINCKKYNVKVDGVLVSKKQKAKSYTPTELSEGVHKISVAGVNGKKVGKYKTVTVTHKIWRLCGDSPNRLRPTDTIGKI